MLCTTEDDVQRRGIDDEHAQTGSGDDTGKVVVIANNAAAEGELELGLDSENLQTHDVSGTPTQADTGTHVEALDDEHGEVHYRLRLREGIDLLRSGDDLATAIGEIRSVLDEVG